MAVTIIEDLRKLLGENINQEAFDTDIMIHLNSVFLSLYQFGYTNKGKVIVVDKNTTWDDLKAMDDKFTEAVKSYIFLKIKIIFDPPSSSFVLETYKQQILEYEWRLVAFKEETGV